MTISHITELLKRVTDPVTGGNIIASLLVKDLKAENNQVSFTLVLSKNYASYKGNLHMLCIETIQSEYPQAEVHIHFETNMASDSIDTPLPQVKNIIAIASGKGGVGKSTVTVNIATTLHKMGYKVGILDADLYGPSIPKMFGLQGKRPQIKQIDGKHKLVPMIQNGISLMSMGFVVEPEQAIVLRGPRLAGVIKQFVTDCLWDSLDYLIIDLPPGTGDVQLTLVQTLPLTGAVMVTTPQDVAVIDAVKAMNMFLLPNINVPILGVVENMSWFTPEELPNNKYFIFGTGGGSELARLCGSMLLGQVPLIQGIREAGDEGKPAAISGNGAISDAFMQITQHLDRQVAIRNETLAPTQIVDVK